MNATTSHLRQTEVDGPPGREIVELVVQDFEEARRMLAHGYSEMAVVRAVGSFEWLMKQAFLEPYLRTVSLSINGEVATLMIRSLLSPQGWNEMPKLLKACWGIEVGKLPLWKDFREIWKVRSEIVHKGARCEAVQALDYIETCSRLTEALFLARIRTGQDQSL